MTKLLNEEPLEKIKPEDFDLVKDNMDAMAKELDERKTGAVLGPHIGVHKDIMYIVGILGGNNVAVICNPTWIPIGKKISSIETFLFDGKNYLCDRYKTITAIFQSFNMKGELVRITKNLTGDKAIIYQHMENYLHNKLQGHPLEDEEPIAEKV